jgi:hypothetical protein
MPNIPDQPTPDFADYIIEHIQKRIYGRIAHEQHNCNYLAWAIAKAGNGSHLEIGTLFGGSAILAVLVKQEFGFDGDIYCVDPLNGYYIGTQWEYPVDPVTNLPISQAIVEGNFKAFGVEDRIHITTAPSRPWPEELWRLQFSSAFIDGDHWGDMPWHDWNMASPRTNRYIVFDNYDEIHPAVMLAANKSTATSQWKKVWTKGITCIVERQMN